MRSIESENPYEAPAAEMSPKALADDTEFLFNDKVIAGIGQISLPEICIVTGTRESLIRRTSKFRWCSRGIIVSRNILFLLAVVVLISSQVGGTGPPLNKGIDALFNAIKLVVTWTIIVGACVFAILSVLLRDTITVEWSISSHSVRRYRRIWVVGTLSALGLMAASEFAVFSLHFPQFLTMPVVGVCIILSSMFAKLAGQAPLSILGRHNGLLLIGGFREPFLKEVQRLAALRSSRESGTTTKPD